MTGFAGIVTVAVLLKINFFQFKNKFFNYSQQTHTNIATLMQQNPQVTMYMTNGSNYLEFR
jgi:hypothetical protein